MEEKYFLTQVQRKNGAYTKGVSTHDTMNAARQAYHAYLGAYAYGHDQTVDYVLAMVTALDGSVIDSCVWNEIPVD